MLSIHPIRAFHDNYIWAIVHPATQKAWVVDPGDAAPVIHFIQTEQLDLGGILITHHHPDHIGGIDALYATYQCPVYAPDDYRIPHTHTVMHDGDTITLDDLDLTLHVMAIPGHTLDHIAYYNNDVLFCGDTLFAGGCGRVFEGTMEQMYNALCRLNALPAHTQIYCAHEYTQSNLAFALHADPNNTALQTRMTQVQQCREHNQPTLPSTIALEQATNPFLRCDTPAIQDFAKQHNPSSHLELWEVFAALRHAKDTLSY